MPKRSHQAREQKGGRVSITHSGDIDVVLYSQGASSRNEQVAEGVAAGQLLTTPPVAALQPGIAFKEFVQVLDQYGFRRTRQLEGFQAYSEPESGALLILPIYQETDRVRPVHVNTFRKLLIEKGLTAPTV